MKKSKNTMRQASSTKESKGPSVKPLGSRVLIRPFTKEELEKNTSTGLGARNFGIILPDTDAKEKTEQGTVIAVGPGEWHDGKRVPVEVKVGDKVAFSKYGYDEVSVGGEEFYLIKEENILAIIK